MKNKLFCLSILLFSLAGCERENETESFTWKNVSPNINSYIGCIDMVNSDEGYIGLSNGYAYQTNKSFTDPYLHYQLMDSIFYNLDTNIFSVTHRFLGEHKYSTIYFTDDGANSWQPINTPFKGDIIALNFFNKYEGFAIASPGGLYRTTDAGNSWMKILDKPILNGRLFNASIIDDYKLSVRDENSLYVYNNKLPFLCCSRNGGINWETILNPYNENFISEGISNLLSFKESSVLYLQSEANLYKSNNLGENWEKIAESVDHFQFLNDSYGFIERPGTGERLFTDDGGSSWKPLETKNLREISYSTYWLDNENYLFYQKDILHYFSNFYLPKKNSSPETMTREKKEQITDFCFPDSKTGYLTGRHGMVLKWEGKGL